MSDEKSLINLELGELTKPATVLVEKISDAIGVWYEPTRTVKLAQAEAKASEIKARASIKIEKIEQRAIDRIIHQEKRKQENIESISYQALESLSENAKAEELEEDWLAYFFKNCDIVSDKEMQSLWSRLLTEEAAQSGTISKRTIDLVASMSKSDAQLFTNFCQFCFYIGDYTPMIMEFNNPITTSKGITFSSLHHLSTIGLISIESSESNYQRTKLDKHVDISYFDTNISLEFKNDENNSFITGKVLLTKVGQELAPICGAQNNEGFFEYINSEFAKQGIVVKKA